ncbi:hypothetical protein KIW84_075927 [Lathyrus oleraceus]|uniref:Retrovirus-related Pol polyprotein from transposon TNT 1-94-like beta-barrel domain-containing protein n=1 Tax=Pisum sativum TaxID=3888 RepID=A0A9D4VV90_PEA|nr:hypothetical protein KIW84_075927 [Pisum sativum]
METISKLKTEVMFLNSKLEEMTRYVRMLNNGSDSLDKILQTRQITGDKSGIGYNESKPESSYTGCKPQAKPKYSHSKSKPVMSQHQRRRQQKGKHQRWRCHYCGKFGHLKPFCYKLVLSKEEWYFDSGCSRHMTGNKDLLTGLHHHAISYVTFGDGAKGEIKGTCKLDCLGVPELDKVLLVKGLTANLISISQLCDQGIKMNISARGTIKSDERQVCGKCQTRMSHQQLILNITFKGEKLMMAQIDRRVDQIGGHVTSHMQSEVGKSFVGLGLQVKQIEGTMCLSQSKSAKNNVEKIGMDSERTPAPTHLRDESGVYAEDIADVSSYSQQGWSKLLMIAYNVTHDVMTLYYDNLNATTMSKNPIQHSWTKHINCCHHSIRKFVEDKLIALKHEMQLADKFARG